MSRPPALTPQQQDTVRRRLADGEGIRPLAREFGVGVATIKRLSEQSERVRNVATQLASAQAALAELPPVQQHAAVALADKLRRISDSMADAAVASADTARQLHELANTRAREAIAGAPEKVGEALHTVATLTKMGNEAATVPLGLMAASRGAGKLPGDNPPDDLPTVIELVAPDDDRAHTAAA